MIFNNIVQIFKDLQKYRLENSVFILKNNKYKQMHARRNNEICRDLQEYGRTLYGIPLKNKKLPGDKLEEPVDL